MKLAERLRINEFTFPNGWRVSIRRITPREAQVMMQKNSINRRFRPGAAKRYAIIMEHGKWLLTPEAICFDPDGVLLNGQHRLWAIVETGIPQECVVWENIPREVFAVIDRGQMRSFADAHGTEKRLAECANLAARVCFQRPADFHVEFMVDLLKESHERLLQTCGTRKRIFSSNPFRLSACIHDLIGNGEHAFQVYRDLIHMETQSLPRIAIALASAALDGRLTASSGRAQEQDLLARAFKVLDPKCAHLTKVQISDVNREVAAIADLIRPNIKGITE